MQNYVFIKDYTIVKACFKLNEFENLNKIVFLYDCIKQLRRKYKT